MPEPLQPLLLFAVVACIAGASYRCLPCRTRSGWVILGVAWVMLSVGSMLNIYHWTLEFTLSLGHPLFTNSDHSFYRDCALLYAGLQPEFPTDAVPADTGFMAVMYICARLFGRSILYPLGFNMVAVLWAMMATGIMARRAVRPTASFSQARIFNGGMLLVAAIAYWLNSGTLLLKDASLQLIVAVFGVCLTFIYRPSALRRYNVAAAVLCVCAVVAVMVMRKFLLLWFGIGALLMLRRDNLRLVVAVLAVIAVAYWGQQIFYDTDFANENSSRMLEKSFFQRRASHIPYLDMLGNYAYAPLWFKLVWLPVSLAVQYMIPLPWNAAADIYMAPTLAYAHQGWVWYAIGGAWLYYMGFRLGRLRHRRPGLLLRLCAWAVALWLVTAFMFAGTVSRYLLPAMPVAVCCALWVWMHRRQLPWLRGWFLCYGAAIAAALAAMYMVSRGG